MALGRLFNAVEENKCFFFFWLFLLLKNGVRIALGRLFDAVEQNKICFFYFSYFLKMGLELATTFSDEDFLLGR